MNILIYIHLSNTTPTENSICLLHFLPYTHFCRNPGCQRPICSKCMTQHKQHDVAELPQQADAWVKQAADQQSRYGQLRAKAVDLSTRFHWRNEKIKKESAGYSVWEVQIRQKIEEWMDIRRNEIVAKTSAIELGLKGREKGLEDQIKKLEGCRKKQAKLQTKLMQCKEKGEYDKMAALVEDMRREDVIIADIKEQLDKGLLAEPVPTKGVLDDLAAYIKSLAVDPVAAVARNDEGRAMVLDNPIHNNPPERVDREEIKRDRRNIMEEEKKGPAEPAGKGKGRKRKAPEVKHDESPEDLLTEAGMYKSMKVALRMLCEKGSNMATVYVISRHWMLRWKQYVGLADGKQPKSKQKQNAALKKLKPAPRKPKEPMIGKHWPGPIENDDIFEDSSKYYTSEDPEDPYNVPLKGRCKGRKDQKIICTAQWELLYSKYGGNPVRRIVDTNS